MWLNILVGVVIFIIAVVGFVIYLTQDLVKLVKQQAQMLREGNIRGAYDQCFSIGFKESVPFDQFENIIQVGRLKENKKIKIHSRQINRDQAQVSGTMVRQDGAAIPINYTFIKEHGGWKIIGFSGKEV